MSDESHTKICKYCNYEIPKRAKVCPMCRKRQGSSALLVAFVLFILFFSIVLVTSGIHRSSMSVTNSNGAFTVQNETTTEMTQTEAG